LLAANPVLEVDRHDCAKASGRARPVGCCSSILVGHGPQSKQEIFFARVCGLLGTTQDDQLVLLRPVPFNPTYGGSWSMAGATVIEVIATLPTNNL
jgi:hypothetical protein